jgi:hypothetical protein
MGNGDGLRYLHAGYAAGAVARLPGCFGANLIWRVGLDADPRSPDRAAHGWAADAPLGT